MSLVCTVPHASSVAHLGRILIQVAHSDTYNLQIDNSLLAGKRKHVIILRNSL